MSLLLFIYLFLDLRRHFGFPSSSDSLIQRTLLQCTQRTDPRTVSHFCCWFFTLLWTARQILSVSPTGETHLADHQGNGFWRGGWHNSTTQNSWTLAQGLSLEICVSLHVGSVWTNDSHSVLETGYQKVLLGPLFLLLGPEGACFVCLSVLTDFLPCDWSSAFPSSHSLFHHHSPPGRGAGFSLQSYLHFPRSWN